MKRMVSLLLAAAMLLSSSALAQDAAKEELLKEMAEEARGMVGFAGFEFNRYREPVAPADFSRMPVRFDLREMGYVPPVRNQGHWGTCWGFAIIGASFVKVDGEWIDWADMLDEHRQDSEAADYLAFDNFGIKAYSYRLDELNGMHSFDQNVSFNGATMHLCSDCAYAYVEQK